MEKANSGFIIEAEALKRGEIRELSGSKFRDKYCAKIKKRCKATK
jgi:hypothetical protein